MDAKRLRDLVYIIGETKDELGGSEWFASQKVIGNNVPQVFATKAIKIYRALHKAMQSGIIASCHDCSDGGLAVALAEVAFAGGLGMDIDLNFVPYRGKKRNDYILFSETASRFVLQSIRKIKENLKISWPETSSVQSALSPATVYFR